MSRDDLPTSVALARLRRAARAGAVVEGAVARAARPVRTVGFPYRAPLVPKGVEVPDQPSRLGADFETEWARTMPARVLRAAVAEGPVRLGVKLLADPEVLGVDRLADLQRAEDPPAVIFAPNHHSHLDTALMAVSVPEPWRSKFVVAAAADYFFDKRVKGVLSALALNAIPIDRESTGRKSSDQLRKLVDDGWSLVIYPEGGRSPDGWGQDFKGGAAYLAGRTGAPVVPVFIDGTGAIFGKGMKRPKPGKTKVVFGAPLFPGEKESTRRFAARIEAAVTMLGDEALTDAWTARRRAAQGTSPRLTGPEFTGWRRQWALTEQRKLGAAGLRRRQKRRWPDIG
ncbi:MAG: lysophospholipid acyltransferase family protein [Ilumatobacteraceae bacterium]